MIHRWFALSWSPVILLAWLLLTAMLCYLLSLKLSLSSILVSAMYSCIHVGHQFLPFLQWMQLIWCISFTVTGKTLTNFSTVSFYSKQGVITPTHSSQKDRGPWREALKGGMVVWDVVNKDGKRTEGSRRWIDKTAQTCFLFESYQYVHTKTADDVRDTSEDTRGFQTPRNGAIKGRASQRRQNL